MLEERGGGEGRLVDELRDEDEDGRLVLELRGDGEGRVAVLELRGDGEGRVAVLELLGARGVTTRPRLDESLLGRESASGTIRAPPILSITRRGMGAVLTSRPRSELEELCPVSFP